MIAALAVACAATTPASAWADVRPGPIDATRLPPPRSPAPPTATEPIGSCSPAHGTPVEPSSGTQLDGFDLPALHRLSRGTGQTVAVIDTGVARHRQLPRLRAGGDYVSNGDGTQDCDGHGTLVAGIIGATPTAEGAFTGVAPGADILAIRQSSNVFRQADGVTGVGDVETLAAAVRTAADLGATVINVSTVACAAADAGLSDGALGAALSYAVDVKNVVVVAAAGNVGGSSGCDGPNPAADPARPGRPDWSGVEVIASPAWYDDYVLTVGSVTLDGAPSSFTLGGPWVDVAAPGEAVVSLSRDGEGTTAYDEREQPISGTSYAAPVVAGLAALVRAREPHLTARQVMRRIEDSARRPAAGWSPLVGFGIVDPLAALGGSTTDPAPSVAGTVPPVAAAEPSERRPRAVAYGGAAACLAGVVAVVLAGRSRRRLHDRCSRRAEFGPDR